MSQNQEHVLNAVDFDPFAAPELTAAVPSTGPQREIWTASQIGPDASMAFNESVSLHLRGPLNEPALAGALRDLAARHESLRATFSADGLNMLIAADSPLEAPVVDLSSLPDARRGDEQQKILAREVETPFDLERGPLVRALDLKLAPEEHLLVLTGHHIIVDGWSWAVLIADLAVLYSARCRGEEPALVAPDRFSAYARQEAEKDATGSRVEAESYWLRQFADEPPVLDLPADRPRPALKTFASRREDVRIDAELVKRLKKMGAREGASFFTVLLAAFKVLLHRLTGADDVVVGIPAAGQAAAGLERLVGHCVNTLALRSRLDAEEPFRALLKRVRSTMLDAYDHQDLTLGSLLRKLPLTRDPSRQLLVSAVFNIDQGLSADVLAFDGLDVRFFSNPRHFETFDLFVNAVESKDGVVLECQYNTDLYDRQSVRGWISAYETLLRSLADEPGQSLGDVPVLSAEEKDRIAFAWNRTNVEHRPEATIHQLFSEQAAAHPDAVALLHQDDVMAYGELDRRSSQLANHLRSVGVTVDTPVALLLERSFETIVALLGILKAGGAYMPLERDYPKERLAFMLEDAGVRHLLTRSSLLHVLPESRSDVLLLDQMGPTLDAQSERCPESGAGPESLAYLMYTSGSTGRPKGVQILHRGVNRLILANDYADLGPEATLLHSANLAFDASTFEIWGALLTGGKCALYPDSVPTADGLARAITRHDVTTVFLTTALFNAVVDEDPSILRTVKQLYTGGEAASPAHMRRFLEAVPDVALHNMYGPTEVTMIATCWRIPRPLPADMHSIPIGRPIRNTRLYVLDARLRPVPVGVAGELCVGGDGLARGYLGRPELTAEKFVEDPFVPGDRIYRTGDLVRYRADGNVDFLGRIDNQVKIRGFRIELGEIESTLGAHPSVGQCVVVARDGSLGKTLVAYVVPQPGTSFSEEEALAHLRQTLPKFMIPQYVVTLDAIPLTGSGKVDRRALPAPVHAAPAEEYVAPRTETEKMLAALWESALGLQRIGVEDDFFRLGGHSLLAAQVLSRLNREQQIALPFRTIFEASTIAKLGAVIDARRTKAEAPPVERIGPRADAGPAPVSIMQERILLLEELDPQRRLVHNVPSAFRLEGPLDVSALEKAVNDFVRRHESLRTTFVKADGGFRQVVHPPTEIRLETVDLSGRPEREHETLVREAVLRETQAPFDLETGPLFRARLLKLGDDAHVFFTVRHNSIWDGWSFDIFRHELALFYAAHRDGAVPNLPALSVTYGDFAAWHRKWLEGPEVRRELDYWRARLDGAQETSLPTDRPRPAVRTYAGADEWIHIPRAQGDAVAEFGKQLGATAFMVFLSAFKLLLYRYSRQPDIVVASPVRNRNRPEIEDIVGLFTNTLMLRTRIDPAETFADLVGRVRATTLDGFEHQELPFDLLAPDAPAMRVLFSLQEARHRETALGEARLSLPHVLPPVASVDLNFWLVEMNDGLAGALNFSTELFDRSTIKRFLTHYRNLLEAVLADPRRPVGEMPLVPVEERRRLGTLGCGPTNVNTDLAALLDVGARVAPQERVFSARGGYLTAAELTGRVDAVTSWLREQGVGPESRVGVVLAPTRQVESLLAVVKTGATAVPLDHRYPPVRIEAALAAAGASHVIAAEEIGEDLAGGTCRVLMVPRQLLPTSSPSESSPGRGAWALVRPDPAGRLLAHDVPRAMATARLEGAVQDLGLGPGDTVVVAPGCPPLTPLLSIAAGSRLVLADEDDVEDPEDLLATVAHEKASVLIAPASTWRELSALEGNGLQNVVGVATEVLPLDVARQLRPRLARLLAMYGPEEAGGWCALARIEPELARIVVGEPLAGAHLLVLDDRGETCPIDVPGEIAVAGNGSPDGARTGDRGRWREDGSLELLARPGGRLCREGLRGERDEIGKCLVGHPALAEAFVVERADRRGRPKLVAYVVRRPDEDVTDSELRRHIRQVLPEPLVPQHYEMVVAIPRQGSGDVDERALPLPSALTVGAGADETPRTEEERLLSRLWSEALGLSGIGRRDNFFNLGGHSLLCLQVVARIEQETGRRLKPRQLLLGTLEQVAAELTQVQAGSV